MHSTKGECEMIVLSRKKNEKLVIGDNVVITVVDIRGDRVRLGIDAPRDIPLARKEVYDALKAQEEAEGGETDAS
jgi:carbon storage regulator